MEMDIPVIPILIVGIWPGIPKIRSDGYATVENREKADAGRQIVDVRKKREL